MLDAIISSVVQRLGELLTEEGEFLHQVDDQVRIIRSQLDLMRGFIIDAYAKQNNDERVHKWVVEVRELAYDAEDVFERYIFEVPPERKGGIQEILKRRVFAVNECKARPKDGSEIKAIQTRILQLNTIKDSCGLKDLSEGEGSNSASEIQRHLRRSYSHFIGEEFVGFEGVVEKLVAHLVNDDDGGNEYYSLVSICGIGGLGKTTMAENIYNHPNIKSHFNACAWVCIPQRWDAKDVLQRILLRLDPGRRGDILTLNDDELMKKLFSILKNERCLIVIDDIGSKNAWDRIRSAFPTGKVGSKLLLTSRLIEVAKYVDPKGFHYEPQFLTLDDSWNLLEKKAFGKRSISDPVEQTEIKKLGHEMLEHCGGLPLAIVLLGGILFSKQSLREWRTVHKSIKSDIGCDNILALSYNELPCKLKTCFIYLGNFSEDSKINPETLYQLWIAENLVLSEDKREGETMRDVAEYYLGELAQRNMVQVELQENELLFGRFKSFHLHDLVKDLCLSKVKEVGFFKTINLLHRDNVNLSPSTNKIRRLHIYLNCDNVYVPLGKEMFYHLRSLFFIITDSVSTGAKEHRKLIPKMLWSYLENSKLLRVLVLEGFAFSLEEGYVKWFSSLVSAHYWLDRAIGRLIHLRYFSLRRHVFIKFPSFISNLKHIQTLDLNGTRFLLFDPSQANVLRKMHRLRHLYLPFLTGSSFIGAKLRLDGLGNLETLVNFATSWCETKDLLKLKNIQTLTADLSGNLDEVDTLTNYIKSITPHPLRCLVLRVFNCKFYSQQGEMVLRNLLGYAFIYRLKISTRFVSEADPPNHLFNSSPNTVEIYSFVTIFERGSMPPPENFPELNVLRLKWNAFRGKEIMCSAMGFPQLRILVLQELPNLEKWTVHEGAMPKLSYLKIDGCEKLEMLPDGLRFVTTLRELKIGRMPQAFKNRIRIIDGKEGEDFFKVRHVRNILMSL